MKKSTIWLLAVIMALTFIGLLYIQIMYMENMIKMRNEQFTEAVKRSLYAVSTSLELDETQRYLDEYLEEEEKKMLSSYEQRNDQQDISTHHQFSIVSPDGSVASFSFREQTSTIITPAAPRPKDHNTLISTYRNMQEAEHIRNILLQHHGNVRRAAAALELSRPYLYQKMKQLGINIAELRELSLSHSSADALPSRD